MKKINKPLIFLYSENARAKIKDLANILHKSSQRLKYSLKVLDKEGVVYHPHCIFDYSYFGLLLFRVYFKGGYIDEEHKVEIIKKLRENPYILSIYELIGEFDLVIEMAAPNPSRLNKELRKVATLIPTLSYYVIILNLVTHLYPRYYLIEKNSRIKITPNEVIVGGDRHMGLFNRNEKVIMENLLKNPKIRFTDLAKQSGLNVKTVTSIFKNLQNKKMIKGFKYVIDPDKLDINNFRLFLNLHYISDEREEQLIDYMLKTKEVVQVNRTVGDWDLEVDIESFDKTTARELIIQIRSEFKDLVETFNIIEFYKYYKKSYLPLHLFQDSKT